MIQIISKSPKKKVAANYIFIIYHLLVINKLNNKINNLNY